HVARSRRAGLVRLRVGDPAARERLPRDLPGAALRPAPVPTPRAADRGDLPVPLARVPDHARRGLDQDSRRLQLARSNRALLPLRDPADPQSAEPRAPLPAARAAARGRRLEPPRRTRGAVVRVRAALGP